MATNEENIKNLKNEIYDIEKEIAKLEKKLEGKRNLLETFESGLIGKYKSIPKWNKEEFLRPEYREGGYFTSLDYYAKCDEFHKMLEKHEIDYMKIARNEYIYLKKEFFSNVYGITWLAEEEQFLPGVKVDVHIDRL